MPLSLRSSLAQPGDAPRSEVLVSAVYGTLLGLSVMAASEDHSAGDLAVLVAVTGLVFAVAHAFAVWSTTGWLGGEGTSRTLPAAVREEWPLAQACLTPAATLLIASLLVSDKAAIGIAIGVSLVQQAGWGVVIGRRAGLGGHRLALSVAGYVVLAVFVASLKALLH